jgi:hypothetical protein
MDYSSRDMVICNHDMAICSRDIMECLISHREQLAQCQDLLNLNNDVCFFIHHFLFVKYIQYYKLLLKII